MVNPVGSAGQAVHDAMRALPSAAVSIDAKTRARANEDVMPGARLARLGPPIDVTHVNEVRAAIASGSYTVDADRLAAAMLALDLPVRGA
jgi:flagellar biosynthesis anti-sigma factor FlgM